MSTRFARPICSMLAVVALTACTAWRPVSQPTVEAIAAGQLARARITRTDSSVVELVEPSVVGKGVVGEVEECGLTTRDAEIRCERTTMLVPLDSVLVLEVRGVSAAATATKSAGFVFVFGFVLLLIANSITISPF